MAKKTTKKTENTNVKIQIPDENTAKKEVVADELPVKSDDLCCSEDSYVRKIKYLSPMELVSYEHFLKMLVLYYEQNLRLDESEGRPVISENRNRYTRLSVLHKRLIRYIENKVIELENYDWEN